MRSVWNRVHLCWLSKIRLTLLLALSLGGACAEQAPGGGPAVPGAGAPSSSGSSGAGAAFPASSGGSGAMNAGGQGDQSGGRNATAGAGGFGAAGAATTGGRPDGSSGDTSTGGAGAIAGGSGGVAGAISGSGGAGETGGGGAAAFAGTGGVAAGSGGGGGGAGTAWVGTWSAAPQLTETENLPPAPGLSNNSLRQIFYVSIGGSRLRLHLSNQYGNAPLVISGVHLARSMSGHTIDAATDRALAFSGSPAVTIPAGGSVTSDELEFMLPAQTKVALTLAFGSTPSDVTGHPGSRTTSYVATGNTVAAVSLASPVSTTHWYYATGIDVVAPASAAVVTFGDSITDGRGSTVDGNDRWPDNLSRRLRSNAATAAIAVLNQAIGGNAVLGEGNGPMAVTRFERDVLNQAGARWVIILHGVNDVGTSTSPTVAAELIAAYEQFVAAARARGIRAYGVPILPFGGSQYDTAAHEAIRQEVNAWIRADGHFDAVIDLDAAVRDPATPARLRSEYDSGDGLHLTPAGYQKMADAIDLALFAE